MGRGGVSVSGYMRSAPGRIRSKPVVPSGKACRVSAGMPRSASVARINTSRAAVAASSLGAQTTTVASPDPAPRAFAIWRQCCPLRLSTPRSEWVMNGWCTGQAMTRTRSASSRAKVTPGWVGWLRRPPKPRRRTAQATSPLPMACRTGW